MENYEFLNKIGSGYFATVFLALRKKTGQKVSCITKTKRL